MSERKKSFYFKAPFLIIVVFPFLISVLYYVVLAADRYVSSSEVVIRSGGNESSRLPGLAVLLGAGNTTSREETLYLGAYLKSLDMLKILNDKLSWKEHFTRNKSDPLFWLSDDSPSDDVFEFYKRMVSAHLDDVTGLLRVEVQSYDPEYSQLVLTTILAESEKFVNEISHRMARDQMEFAKGELEKSLISYNAATDNLISFQAKTKTFDAQGNAKGRAEVIYEIEATVIRDRATLATYENTLSPNSPQIRQIKSRIKGAEQQLQAERSKLLVDAGANRLNVLAADYRNLTIQAAIAEETYKVNISAVENARIEATKKIRSLVTVSTPSLSELAAFPRKIYNLITIFIVLLIIFGIYRFVAATVEDHRD